MLYHIFRNLFRTLSNIYGNFFWEPWYQLELEVIFKKNFNLDVWKASDYASAFYFQNNSGATAGRKTFTITVSFYHFTYLLDSNWQPSLQNWFYSWERGQFLFSKNNLKLEIETDFGIYNMLESDR